MRAICIFICAVVFNLSCSSQIIKKSNIDYFKIAKKQGVFGAEMTVAGAGVIIFAASRNAAIDRVKNPDDGRFTELYYVGGGFILIGTAFEIAMFNSFYMAKVADKKFSLNINSKGIGLVYRFR